MSDLTSWKNGDLEVQVLYSWGGTSVVILLSAGDTQFLLDVGDGALRDLKTAGMEKGLDAFSLSEALGAVLVSHEHFDHIGGLYSLLSSLHKFGRRRPLPILVPEPSRVTRDFVEVLKAQRADWGEEIGFTVEILELNDGDETDLGPLTVRAFAVQHCSDTSSNSSGLRALGYSICCGSTRIVYSGDSGLCPALEREARGADLAILEASYRSPRKTDHHMSRQQAEQVRRLAKEYMFVHLIRGLK